MRISWLPRAILIVRIRGVVRRYNVFWLPWAILAVLGWCIFHDHDSEYASRSHGHYKLHEHDGEYADRYHGHSRIDELEDELHSFGSGRMDKLETELKHHNHYGEYADDDHSHSEYSWEGHEH